MISMNRSITLSFGTGRFIIVICIIATTLIIARPAAVFATHITITSGAGFPNGRTSNDPPTNAIDGSIFTFTWTTEAFNEASPSHLAIGFDSTDVDRLRSWKDDDGGGGQNIKNLTIQYTTDTGLLSSRSWTTVTGLVNGFNGTEFLDATSVNLNGTVTGDIHDSTAGDGWASLTFDAITATGLRISFRNPVTVIGCSKAGGTNCNQYRVGEFEAHFDTIAVPEPDTIFLF